MHLPETATRVAQHTPERLNRKLQREAEARVCYYAEHPTEIDARLAELDREWDIERALEANAAALVTAGTLLGLVRSRRWLVLPAVVGTFLLQHALEGWCPPLPVLRRLGFRTQTEIEAERCALERLRSGRGEAAAPEHGAERAH